MKTYISLGAMVALLVTLSGCSTTLPEWAGVQDPYTYGYKPGDPCIRCGEGWTFIPPSAQKQH